MEDVGHYTMFKKALICIDKVAQRTLLLVCAKPSTPACIVSNLKSWALCIHMFCGRYESRYLCDQGHKTFTYFMVNEF